MSYMNKQSDLDSGIMAEYREAQELESELPKRPEPWEKEVKTNLLTPLFEIVSHIAMETDIELDFGCRRMRDGSILLCWYIGDVINPTAGDFSDRIYTDDLDEDKLNRWVAELEALAFEPETPDQDSESREDFERVENTIFNRTQT